RTVAVIVELEVERVDDDQRSLGGIGESQYEQDRGHYESEHGAFLPGWLSGNRRGRPTGICGTIPGRRGPWPTGSRCLPVPGWHSSGLWRRGWCSVRLPAPAGACNRNVP